LVALALAVLLAPAAEAPAHKSILKVKFAERRALNVVLDNFVLTDQNGKRVEFSKLRGKPVVINFMYTSCPDVCPLLTASLKIVRDHMNPAEAKAIRFLSITTDPEVDTPKVLKAYSRRHQADGNHWSWLTGEARELAPVWQAFAVRVRRLARGLIEHTTLTVVADGEGHMRFAYFGSAPNPDVLLKDLRALATPPSSS
jgi:protein SCO1/2